ADAAEVVGYPQKLPTATARRDVAADVVRESEETDLVALADADVREHERGVHRVIELCERAESARHHPPGVDQQKQPLLPLGLVLDRDRPAASRGRWPGDRPRIVVGLVVAQP